MVPSDDFDTGNSAPPPDDLFEEAIAGVNAETSLKNDEEKAPRQTPSTDDLQRNSRKVQLDLDGAPFLEKEKEEETPAKTPPKAEPVEMPKPGTAKPDQEDANAAKKARKKKIIKIAGAVVLLIIIAMGAKMFLSGGEEPVEEPKEEGPIVKVVPTTPPVPDAPQGPAFTVKFDSFWVEQRGPEGEIRFLLCQFSLPVETEPLNNEILSKTLIIRDALYYYLKNRPMTFLNDANATDELKTDVAGVINENLNSGKIDDVYIEEYRISGP